MDESRSEDLPSWDADADVDPEDDPGEDAEALIERADRPYASGYGTTASEEAAGESLDQRLAEERPDAGSDEFGIEIVDGAAPGEEGRLVGAASARRDPFMAPEDAAVRVRPNAPGGADDAPADEDLS
ncbi:MAG: hypothetical protein ACRDJU_04440 [Actinomycetota bacterium]